MMRVSRANEIDVHSQATVDRDGTPELLHQAGREVGSDHRFRHACHELEIRTPGKVNDETSKRLVKRGVCVAVARYAGAVANGDLEGLSESNADIFDRVMRIHRSVTRTSAAQVETTVPAERIEHVVQKEHAGFHRRRSGAI